MNRLLSRRTILRGAGVALTLPWLESLAPRGASAAGLIRKRYLPIYLPNGSDDRWTPSTFGVGNAWSLSGILEPLTPLKGKLNVLTGMENGTSFNADRSSSVEPSHGRQPAAWLTCMDPQVVRDKTMSKDANVPSIDQRIAKFLKAQGTIPYDSLQVGLSTAFGACDGQPCSQSRTVSWDSMNRPMYKLVDPLDVFNKLVGVGKPSTPDGKPDVEAQKRAALNKSVLDAVQANTRATQQRLGKQDQQRLEQFLSAVRDVEMRATNASAGMGGLACMPIAKPTLAGPIRNDNYARQNTATYNKGTHADIMNDLIVMAFQCDATRVITYMLEDERSEFTYDHVKVRSFAGNTSAEKGGTCGEYHSGGQHGPPDAYATITWWNVLKVADLCRKLDAVKEENGSMLDNTLVMFGACMHDNDHACNRLPLVLIGSGGGTFKTDQHVKLENRWLRDLHHTVMTRMYGMSGPDVDAFGVERANVPRAEVMELLL